MSKEKKLRESLARTLYLWRLEMKQNFSQLLPLEILCVHISACKPKSEKKTFSREETV